MIIEVKMNIICAFLFVFNGKNLQQLCRLVKMFWDIEDSPCVYCCFVFVLVWLFLRHAIQGRAELFIQKCSWTQPGWLLSYFLVVEALSTCNTLIIIKRRILFFIAGVLIIFMQPKLPWAKRTWPTF